MRELGGQPIYTRYDTGGHAGAWQRAYNAQTPLVPWMMSQRRGQAPSNTFGPFVEVTSPSSEHVSTTADSYALSGNAASTTSSITYRNSQYYSDIIPVTGTSSWNVSVDPLRNDKSNEIYIEAESPNYVLAGNGITTSNTYVYINRVSTGGDATQPVLSVTQPAGSPVYTVYSSTLDIAGTVSDDTGVTALTWENNLGGSDSITIAGSWQYDDVPLYDGMNRITVTALDAANNHTEQTLLVVAIINQAPEVTAGEDQDIVLLANGAALNGTVTDDGLAPGAATPGISWSKVSGPGQVTFGDVNMAATSASFSAEGTYVLELSATDGEFTTTDTITLTVYAVLPPRTVLYDFGTQSLPQGNWNLVNGAGLGDEVLNAIDTDGNPTVFDLHITDGFKGRHTEGLSGTALYPDEATTDSFYVNNANLGQVTFSDLDPSLTYDITIFASASFDAANDGVGEYTIGSTTLTLDAADNASATIKFSGVSPGASGEIVLSCIASDNSGEAFINVVELLEQTSTPSNQAPVVDAGIDQSVMLSSGATLAGSVSDDGLAPGTATPTISWSQVSGPGTVNFVDDSAVDTSVSFSAEGIYVLELSATDGVFTASDSLTITVNNVANAPPVVDAGADQVVSLSDGALLSGIVSDDGLAPGNATPTSVWSQVSGPGVVSFADASDVNTTATFSIEGTYFLELSATDGIYTTDDTVTIVVNESTPAGQLTVLYDFGTASLPAGNWNLVRYAGVGDEVLDAIDTDGNATTIDLVITDAFKGRNTEGLSGTGLYPDDATTDSYYVNNANLGEMRFEGLNPSSAYNITIFGSAAFDAANDGVGEYAIGSTTLTLDASENSSQRITFYEVFPDASGHIVLSMIASDNSGEAFVNVIELTQLASNEAPVVDAGADQNVELSAGALLAGTVSDDGLAPGYPTPTSSWAMVSGPGVATFADSSLVDTSVAFSTHGSYVLELTASDGVLNASDTVTITVNDDTPQTVSRRLLFDFGGQFYPSTENWNLVRYGGENDAVLDLIDVDGNSTGMNLVVTDAFKARNTLGPISTGLYHDDATFDSYYTNLGNLAEITLGNLNPLSTFDITIFASAAFDAANDGVGEYTIGGTTLTLDATGNTNQTITFTGVQANSLGEIAIGFHASDDTGYAFINVLDIVESTSIVHDLTSAGLVANTIGSGATGSSRILTSGEWEVDGDCIGLDGIADSLVFESESVSGNFQALVKVNDIYGGSAPQAGLAIRESLDADARTVAVATNSGSNYEVASRLAVAGALTRSTSTESYSYPNAWLLLERTGDSIQVATSTDGVTFVEIDEITLTGLSASVHLGIFSSSGVVGETTRAVFTDYTVIPF
ncbi:PKD domain-containing protein [Cerasicoccus frondis]|uniref:PKD domain-containing protein n=1 Tax=Cerasicoccus frondis TaxID=490090 RepID=UPI00285255FF|nr:hypothetical protein [Cerasicoccus frondis]